MMTRCAAALVMMLSMGTAWAGDAVFREVRYAGDDGGPSATPAQYRNPVVAGFYPDPSAIRVGDDFYLVTSTFGYFPGLPVFHSTDLVSWTQVGNAIHRPGQINYGEKEELTRGLFAATLAHHDGTFYIANTCFYCDRGNFVVTAKNPAGPWSDPVWLGISGIDPSLFFDDDGSAWVVHNDVPDGKLRYDGHRAIWLQRFDFGTREKIGRRILLVDGGADPATNPEHVEGPHVFKHDGWYYLTAAEGGTGEQHAQMVWRSRTLAGPYQPSPSNPSLTQRDLDPTRPDPVTSTGHAQFVKLKDGTWWAVFLATRPYRGNQYNLGRETFLLPVTWKDGWPVILPRGERVPMVAQRPDLPRNPQPLPTSGPMAWTERFDAPSLPLSWMTLHPPQTTWYTTGKAGLTVTPGTMPLGAFGTAPGQPSYLAHRLQHHKATLETTLASFDPALGELAGLALLQNEYGHYVLGVERDAQGLAVSLYRRSSREGAKTGDRLARIPLDEQHGPVSLRLRLDGPRLDAQYALASGEWKTVATGLDASLLSVETAGGFIGNTFGPYAVRR
ncbi:glycoside hydrolase family 43 protein [Pseudoxanthomonas mexicana]|uniref:glycoside hydrolase family 43 protein n=1 Tax=Pseudoxanthomonas mexicana TaxID=128785 RepID=UPI000AD83403|nr:glycoside hydrolase family 43 protein [Pseudoxanthomonas mexicana]